MTQPSALSAWMDEHARLSAAGMLRSISATDLRMHRPGFSQTVVPAPGSVLASPRYGDWTSEPDYFFHWLRDSALIMQAVIGRIEAGDSSADWAGHFGDFVRFSLEISRISGRQFLETVDFRSGVRADLRQFLRPDEEVAAVEGERTLAEVRTNADGTLDFTRWSRPQNDGPALRALAAMRFEALGPVQDDQAREGLEELVLGDLDFTQRHWAEPCHDIWEEESAHHYYTQVAQLAALRSGADWATRRGDAVRAARFRDAATALAPRLDDYWSPEERIYRCTLRPAGPERQKVLDIAVILGAVHAGLAEGRHSVLDDRVQATLLQLEAVFESAFAINRARGPGLGVALGRYPGDRFFDGGAWYIATFGAAELCYRLAAAIRSGAASDAGYDTPLARGAADRDGLVRALLARGDATMAMARRFVPPTGELSEQFDPDTGEQKSARDLSWSYAAFLTAYDARRRAVP
jgi:glucoamylase